MKWFTHDDIVRLLEAAERGTGGPLSDEQLVRVADWAGEISGYAATYQAILELVLEGKLDLIIPDDPDQPVRMTTREAPQ